MKLDKELYAKRASALFRKGYNCSQAILLSFSELTELPDSTAEKIAFPFGGGIGRLREVCGAFSGAVMVLGLAKLVYTPGNDLQKMQGYSEVQDFAKRFEELNGSIICRELLGLPGASKPVPQPRTEEFYAARPCENIIKNAARALAEILSERE